MKDFDIVVFGAGIAGASLAGSVAPHRSVLLVERESQPGMHTTGRSAAMFMESYGPPGVRALTRASRAFYTEPPAAFTTEKLLAPRGALYVAAHGQEGLLQATRAELAASCPNLAVLGPLEAAQQGGCLQADLVHGALLDPGAMDIDVHALHQAYLRGLRREGGILRCGVDLVSAAHDGGRWRLRFDDGEEVLARHVVDAAGAWADELAIRLGAAPVGIVPMRRSAFTFEAPASADVAHWPCVAGIDESYYFKPDAGRLLGSPANADPSFPHDVRPEELDIALGIHRIEAMTTLRIRRPTSTWAGLRSFVADGELVIGFDTACPGFFWFAGQGGYGIQSAAAAASLAVDLLRDAAPSEALLAHGVDAGRFSPQRLR
jgi:D-arginine dehydrogenase